MKKIFRGKSILFGLLLLVIAGLAGSTYYFYRNYQTIKSNPDKISQEQVKSVTGAISKFMELPSDEQPTLATVTDQEKLKDQDFFKKAMNGDMVLIYTKAHKAILYRPSTNRVIEFAPLTFGNQAAADASPEPTVTVKVAILNGTKTAGLTAEIEKKIADVGGITVSTKAVAAKTDYTRSQIFDLTGNNKDLVSKIAQTIDGDVMQTLPDGETKPAGVEILIIAGK